MSSRLGMSERWQEGRYKAAPTGAVPVPPHKRLPLLLQELTGDQTSLSNHQVGGLQGGR